MVETTINTNPSPLVSVIIPFLNGKEWLSEAVKSVMSQSYQNWQIIMVDDGSGEEASSLAKFFAEQTPGKIICTEHPGHINRGVAASRNLGVSMATGDIIAFLDSDDCWLPGKLSSQVKIFNAFPDVDVVCESSKYWFSWENPTLSDMIIHVGANPNRLYQPPELVFRLYPLGKGAAPCPSGVALRREAMKRSGGFEESFTGPHQFYEDQAFLIKLYLHQRVYISEASNNLYRQRSGSLMQSVASRTKYRKTRAFFLKWLSRYLRKEDIRIPKLRMMFDKATFEVRQPFLYKLAKKFYRMVTVPKKRKT